jgi:hypothetical protein
LPFHDAARENALFSRPVNGLREMLLFQLKADRVVFRIGKLGKPVGQAENKQKGGVAADRDAGVALFNLE